MSDIVITEKMLDSLRERVREYLTEKRYSHTLAVEKEAAALGMIYLPDDICALRAAALLHDITKKLSVEKQLQLFDEFGIIKGTDDKSAPKLLHAKTAASLVAVKFPEFADEKVISAVRWHTTGRAGMSVFDSVIYLADYIEETRTFDDCVALRRYFYETVEGARDAFEKNIVLYKTMVMSFDMTVKGLMEDSALIDRDTVEARNYFLLKLRECADIIR